MNTALTAFSRRPLAVCILAACIVLQCTSDGHAFRRQSSVSGPGHRSASNTAVTTRTPGGYTRDATTTGPGQHSVNRSSQGQWDSSGKNWNKSTTYTGPQGNSGTVEHDTDFSR